MYIQGHIPERIGNIVRRIFIPLKHRGTGVVIRENVWIEYPQNLSIGDNSRINPRCILNAGGGIEICSNSRIGPDCLIYSQNQN